MLQTVVRLRAMPRRDPDTRAQTNDGDDIRVQEVQEVLPERYARVRGQRRILPALRQSLRPRGCGTKGQVGGGGRRCAERCEDVEG